MFCLLIVDDNKFDREGIRDLINWDEFEISRVEIACNGIDGYNKAIEIKPDFIITDIAMPILNGIDMVKKIKEKLTNIKTIFMSCYDDFNFAKNAVDLEVNAYILKPIDLQELKNALLKITTARKNEIYNDNLFTQLRKSISENLPLLREQFLRELIYKGYNYNNKDEIYQKMRFLEIDNLINKFFSAIYIVIDNYEDKINIKSIEEKYTILYGIRTLLKDSFAQTKDMFIYIINTEGEQISAVVFSLLNDKEETINATLKLLNTFKENVNNKLDINLTIGVGEFSNYLGDLQEIFEKTAHIVESKFYTGGNRILLASEIKGYTGYLSYNLQQLKKEIILIIDHEKYDAINIFIDKYFPLDNVYEPTYIKSLAFSIVNILEIIFNERNIDFNSIFNNNKSILLIINSFETINQLRDWISLILNKAKSIIQDTGNSRYNKIVDDIKNEIENNYPFIQNIEQIVGKFYISASHANFIFKKQTGKTIFDYLMDVRIEVAKKMLEDPYVKIYEIADKIGYQSKSYFASVFKEYTGMSPKQYRDKFIKR